MQNIQILCSSWKQASIIRYARYQITKHTISCNKIGTQREDKDANCSTNRVCTHDAGSEQCCANTGLERSCTRMNSNMYHYGNTGNNSNLKIVKHPCLR